MLTKVAVRQANCAQFCGAPTLDDVTLEGCPLEERIERFNYDYRMQCQYGGFVRVPADVYWDKAIINGGVVPCGDCEDGIEVAGEVTTPRDPDDRALSNDGVPGAGLVPHEHLRRVALPRGRTCRLELRDQYLHPWRGGCRSADRDRTREHYRKLFDQQLLDAFGTMPRSAIRADHVRAWHPRFTAHTPTLRSHPE